MVMAQTLTTEQLHPVLHKASPNFGRKVISLLIKLGGDPCWFDPNGITCVQNALEKHNGIFCFL